MEHIGGVVFAGDKFADGIQGSILPQSVGRAIKGDSPTEFNTQRRFSELRPRGMQERGLLHRVKFSS